MTYTFKKDGATKFVTKDNVAEELIAMDWTCDEYGSPKTNDDREALVEKAKALGLKPHHKAKAETIRKMIEEADDNST